MWCRSRVGGGGVMPVTRWRLGCGCGGGGVVPVWLWCRCGCGGNGFRGQFWWNCVVIIYSNLSPSGHYLI